MNITIVSSSVRVGQLTLRVARGLSRVLDEREGIQHRLLDLSEYDIPPLEYVLTKHPAPPRDIVALGRVLDASDAMIFVSPEYNGSYSSVLKNLVDYFPKSTFAKKTIGIASVTSGAGGGMRGAMQLQQLVLALWAFPIPQMMLVPKVKDKFDENGILLEEKFRTKIDVFLEDFLWLSRAVATQKQLTLPTPHL